MMMGVCNQNKRVKPHIESVLCRILCYVSCHSHHIMTLIPPLQCHTIDRVIDLATAHDPLARKGRVIAGTLIVV